MLSFYWWKLSGPTKRLGTSWEPGSLAASCLASRGQSQSTGPTPALQALPGLMAALLSTGERTGGGGQAGAVLTGALTPVCVLRLFPQPLSLHLEWNIESKSWKDGVLWNPSCHFVPKPLNPRLGAPG